MQSERIRLGMLTPSSDTALEPITAAMPGDLPHVSAHFARFTRAELLPMRALFP
jgi:maleate isomerase